MNHASRKEAITRAKALIERHPIFLDTETTGIGPRDNIVEISILNHDGQVLIETLVKPVGKISSEAMAVHGITDEMVQDASRWPDVWDGIESVLSGRLVGIYNADFDLRMMQQSHKVNWMQWSQPEGMEVFCIMKLYAQFYGRWNPRRGNYQWQSLETAGRQCGIPLPNSHRARDDTLLTQAILHYMAEYEI
jgi:DNA polymerase III epsilon subunit-like protein